MEDGCIFSKRTWQGHEAKSFFRRGKKIYDNRCNLSTYPKTVCDGTKEEKEKCPQWNKVKS